MKLLPFLLMLFIVSCSSPAKENETGKVDSTSTTSTTNVDDDGTTDKEENDSIKTPTGKEVEPAEEKTKPAAPKPSPRAYANKRFKDVTVEKIADNKYRIKGKGQIFEASFSWVVEDGHNEVKNGFAMTDAGAPEWATLILLLK
jgi:hypothetical protein